MKRASQLVAGLFYLSLASLFTPSASAQTACAPAWQVSMSVTVGQMVSFNQSNWQAIQPEISAAPNWTPPATPALWRLVSGCQVPPQTSVSSGQSVAVSSPEDISMDSLPQASSAQLAAIPSTRHRPMNGLSDAQNQALENRMRAIFGSKGGAGNASPVFSAPNTTASITPFSLNASTLFQGLNQQTVCPGQGCAPPDMSIAVGPTLVLQAINNGITVTDKSGNTQAGFPKAINTFFGLSTSVFTTDPRASYDWVNNRYVVILLKIDFTAQQGFLMLAASATSDPTKGWHIYSLPIGAPGQCPDFPTLGQDHTNWNNEKNGVLYVGLNMFTSDAFCGNNNPQLVDNHLLILPKSSIYAGAGFTYFHFDGFTVNGQLVDTLQPADVSNLADRPRAEFIVNSFNINFGGNNCQNGCNGLEVWAISNPFGFLSGGPQPEVSAVFIPTRFTYLHPAGAVQPNCPEGNPACVDPGDVRISATVKYSAGSLWGALESLDPINQSGENSPIWFEIHPILNDNDDARCGGALAGQCPQIVAADERQEDCFNCGGFSNNGSGYFATLQPDPENNVTMVYNYSDSATFPGVAMTSRRVTQPDNTFNGVGTLEQPGLAFYTIPGGRFGDYSATAPDLTSATSPMMWFAGMYSTPNCARPDFPPDCSWATVIGQDGYTNPSQH